MITASLSRLFKKAIKRPKAILRRPAFDLRNRILGERPVTVNLDALEFKLAPKGDEASKIWSIEDSFNRQILQFLVNMLEPGMLVVDIGATIGLFALAAAKKDASISVYALESNPAVFPILLENIHLNQLKNIYPIHGTISSPETPGETTTLEQLLLEYHLKHVHCIKITAGGAELPVLQGAKNLLTRADAPLVFYQSSSMKTKKFHYHPAELIWYLQDLGYQIFALDNQTGRPSLRKARHGFDFTAIAAKMTHPAFQRIAKTT